MMRKLQSICILITPALLFVGMVLVSPSLGDDLSSHQLGAVHVGFNGAYKLGCWTPVEVEIAAGPTASTAEVQLIVADSDGVPTQVSSEPITLVPGQPARVRMFARFGQIEGELIGRLVVGGSVVAERVWQPGGVDDGSFPKALSATDRLIVTVGSDPAIASALRLRLEHVHYAHVKDAATLPSTWFGYESVDQLVLVTSNAVAFDGLKQDQRASALLDWTRLGGQVLLTAGQSATELFAPGMPLAKLAPGELVEVVSLRQLAPIESYAVASQQIGDGSRIAAMEVAQFRNLRGVVDVSGEIGADSVPLIARSAYGLGEVTLVMFDVDLPPIATWNERGLLLAKLLGLPTSRPAGEDRTEENLYNVSTLGYNDLSGQLRSALFEFRDVSFVSFFVVGWLIFGYLLLIGPVDYFVVRRWLKRPELTWVTFPLTVVAVSVAAYYAAYHLKGTTLRTNQAEVVDVDLSTGTIRGTVWSSLFSPATEPYDLALQAKVPREATVSNSGTPALAPQTLLAWLGLPGDALGGMNRQGASATLAIDHPYQFSPPLNAIAELPIQVWSTKSLISRWQTTAKVQFTAELEEDIDKLLRGRITNDLGVALEDGRLFYDRWAYQLPKLADGASVRIGVDVQPVTTKTMLTQQRIVASKEIVASFDTQSKDVPRILELMMFHELAGGNQYTGGLFNRYQGYLDLSQHVQLGQAIFVARVRGPGSTLLRDGKPIQADEDHHWLYYRFVIPVTSPAANEQ